MLTCLSPSMTPSHSKAARGYPGPEPSGTRFDPSSFGRRPGPGLGDRTGARGGDVLESLLLFADM